MLGGRVCPRVAKCGFSVLVELGGEQGDGYRPSGIAVWSGASSAGAITTLPAISVTDCVVDICIN